MTVNTKIHAKITPVFIHGGPVTEDYLAPFLKPYFPTGFFFDQDISSNSTQEQLITQLESKVEPLISLPEDKVVLIGHSWGSILATHFLNKHSRHGSKYEDKIVGVVIVSAFLNSNQELEFKSRYSSYNSKQALYYSLLSDFELTDISKKEFKGKKITNLEYIDWMMTKFSPSAFSQLIPEKFDYTDMLRETKVPILNIVGSQDRRHLTDMILKYGELSDLITNIVINEAGGSPFLIPDHAKIFSTKVKEFISSLGFLTPTL